MERPRVTVSTPENGYDEEMTQVQADFIAFSDVLLEYKDSESPLTFVDFVVDASATDLYQQISNTSLGKELLIKEGEQMAIESQNPGYPQLDMPKVAEKIDGVSVRVYGWDYDKYRFDDDTRRDVSLIDGEVDKTREIKITFYRAAGKEEVGESIAVWGADTRTGHMNVSREVWMSAYAETGYEGHGFKSSDTMTDESIEQLLEVIAGALGDSPKTVQQWNLERQQSIAAKAHQRGVGELFDQLQAMMWPAQTVSLCEAKLARFDGRSVASLLEREDDEGEQGAAAALEYVIDWWQKRSGQ